MIRSTISLIANPDDHRVARLAAAAIALSFVESAIPMPLPGVKPGLANIVTLVVLARYGLSVAAWVTVLRVLAGALLLGQLFSPGFFMSLCGALCSLAVLGAAIRLPEHAFGPISWSLLGAFAHIGGQLLLARLWLIPHDGLFYLLPAFSMAALAFGMINGIVAAQLIGDFAAPANRPGE